MIRINENLSKALAAGEERRWLFGGCPPYHDPRKSKQEIQRDIINTLEFRIMFLKKAREFMQTWRNFENVIICSGSTLGGVL